MLKTECLPVGLDGSVEESCKACFSRDQLVQAQLKKRPQHPGGSEEFQDGRVHGEGAEACGDLGQDVDLVRHFSSADLELFPLDFLHNVFVYAVETVVSGR